MKKSGRYNTARLKFDLISCLIKGKRLSQKQKEIYRYLLPYNEKDAIFELFHSRNKGNILTGNLFPEKYTDLFVNYDRVHPASYRDEFLWSCYLFIKYKQKVRIFLSYKDGFEKALLSGDYANAEKFLNDTGNEVSSSLWEIEQRLLLNELWKGTEANKRLLGEIIKDNIRSITSIFTEYLSDKIETGVSKSKYDAYIDSLCKSYKENTKLYDWVKYNLIPGYAHSVRDKAITIHYQGCFSLIDRYLAFTDMLCQPSSYIDIDKDGLLKKYATALCAEFDDLPLEKLKFIFEINGRNYTEELFSRIIYASDLYTTGNYSKCIDHCSNMIEMFPNILDYYILLSKSFIYSGNNSSSFYGDGIKKRIVESLCLLLNIDTYSHTTLDSLKKLYYSISGTTLGKNLYYIINDYFDTKQHTEKVIYIPIHKTGPDLLFLSHVRFIIPDNSIFKAISSFFPSESTNLWAQLLVNDNINAPPQFSDKIPDFRRYFYEAEWYKERNNYHESISRYLSVRKYLDDHGIRNDMYLNVLIGIFDSYLGEGNFQAAAVVATDECSKRAYLADYFDLKSLLDVFADSYKHQGEICMPLIKHFAGSDDSDIYISYQNFLDENGFKRPSEIIAKSKKFDRLPTTRFLSNVCKINVINNSSAFTNTEDIENERIRILSYLTDTDKDNYNLYSTEIDQITKRQAIRRAIQRIGEGKISVDINSIKSKLRKSLAENFKRHKEFSGFQIDDLKFADKDEIYKLLDDNRIDDKDDVKDIIIYSGLKFNIFKEMFFEVRDMYISSNEYGLNSYLSGRFRHGTMAAQIRRCFEANQLISEVDSSTGDYIQNRNWIEVFCVANTVPDKTVTKIFSNFSRLVDQKITTLKNMYIQITTTDGGHEYFNYHYNREELTEIYQTLVLLENDFDAFLDGIFNELTERTNLNLKRIREYIENTFLSALLNDLDTLTKDIDSLGAKSPEFTSAVASCRTGIQNDLAMIARWFNFVTTNKMDDFNLDLSINTSLQIFNNIHNQKFEPTITNTIEGKFIGENFFHFVDIFSILLENIFEHSMLGIEETQTYIIAHQTDGDITIKIANKILNELDNDVLREKTNKIQKDLQEHRASSRYVSEGGTGIFKIQRILQFALGVDNYNICIDINDENNTFNFTLQLSAGEVLNEGSGY